MDPYSRSLLSCAVEPLAFGMRDTSNLLRRGIYPLPSWMAGSGTTKSQKFEEAEDDQISTPFFFFFPSPVLMGLRVISSTEFSIEGPSSPIRFNLALGQAPPGSRADLWLTGTLGEAHGRGLAGWGLPFKASGSQSSLGPSARSCAMPRRTLARLRHHDVQIRKDAVICYAGRFEIASKSSWPREKGKGKRAKGKGQGRLWQESLEGFLHLQSVGLYGCRLGRAVRPCCSASSFSLSLSGEIGFRRVPWMFHVNYDAKVLFTPGSSLARKGGGGETDVYQLINFLRRVHENPVCPSVEIAVAILQVPRSACAA
ncbi:hypothetical protein BO82DRAFT_106091 [Aspergillus uvarum CBS 121591]|uniref:Uncharacterized protein n=1 Tax=Aspergillus uvarum CBS 121591 TaxID=1448315 RepID=A0A319C9U3_9EURO|nr:hypothetical protein BO82DRAFT_106091 [Aspergillus uvarum CBS 121591]PYH80641.1 hypothetical protein BO82DRAFT_106091 [Aspergillus uvarum CBS 121591]